MATQNLTDLKEDMINVIVENVHTRIFLPNNAATAKTVKPLYENFGLNDVEIDTIRSLQPKRDYFLFLPYRAGHLPLRSATNRNCFLWRHF